MGTRRVVVVPGGVGVLDVVVDVEVVVDAELTGVEVEDEEEVEMEEEEEVVGKTPDTKDSNQNRSGAIKRATPMPVM